MKLKIPYLHPKNEFERAMTGEMLHSEIRRVSILLWIFAIGFVLTLITAYIMPFFLKEHAEDLHKVRFGVYLSLLIVFFEGIVLVVLKTFQKRGIRWPALGRYMNIFLETSIPTALLVIIAHIIPPAEALTSPASYLYLVFITMATLRLDFKLCLFTGFVAFAEYGGFLYFYYDQVVNYTSASILANPVLHIVKSALLLAGGLVSGLIAIEIKKRFLNSLNLMEERKAIVDLFGRHVSPEVVNKLLDQHSEMESEMRSVCVMFLDIRNFTSFSESQSPVAVISYLNNLFDFMVEIVNKNHGIINKFLGDGFMAVFGAPLSSGRDSENALLASLEILDELERRNADGSIPATRIGIGLHSGEAMTGNVGSSQRKEYTIIGDTVNVASRIEQLNKKFSTQLLVSQSVYDAVSHMSEIDSFEKKEPIPVKGRQQPVEIYAVR